MTQRRSRTAPAASLLAALMLALGAGSARAQTSTTGALEGVVRDAAGEPLVEALLTLAPGEGGGGRSIVTDDGGRFRFAFLAPGTYTLAIELLGFRPVHILDIPVRPGRVTRAPVALEAVAEASPEPASLRFEGAAAGVPAGSGAWLPNPGTLPTERQELRDLIRLTSRAGESLDHEGLPGSWMSLELDGTTFRAARHPALPGAAHAATGFALRAYEAGMVLGAPTGAAGEAGVAGVFGAHSLPGTPERRLELDARWSGDVLPGSSLEDDDVPGYTDLLAGATVRGSAAEQSASYLAGISVRRLERPVSAAWPINEGTTPILDRATAAGIDVLPYGAGVLEDQAISAFGAASLPVGSRHRLGASFHFAGLPSIEHVAAATGLVQGIEGTDIVGGLALQSAFDAMDNELRVAFTRSVRESIAGDSLRPTVFVSDALALGGGAPARTEESGVRVTDALTFRSGGYTFTAGGSVLFSSYLQRTAPLESVYFGGLPQLAASTGVFERFEPGPEEAEWGEPVYAAFAEVRTEALRGLDVQLGVRAEREGMPGDEVRLDTLWLRLTTLNNTGAGDAKWRLSPRASLSWDLNGDGRWLVDASAGIYHERHDPLLLAAWQQQDGTASMRRFAGPIAWPYGTNGDGTARNRLLLPEPDFEPVKSTRIAGGLRHALAAGTALHVSAVARRTENLPRRLDLNLPLTPAYRDQYGRAVYLELVKQGSLLATETGSGRRLAPWDEVAGVESNGEGDYWGVTAGIEREVAQGLSIIGSYTYSRATDDWFGAGSGGGWLSSRPPGLDDENWADGTSDFDVPHRAAAGVFYDAPIGLRLSALFRVESGRPFTPGFRYGVDANGDGAFGNDPAFIDAAVPGMGELLAEWSCLAEATGAFVQRNGCRAESVTALDLGARLRVVRVAGAAASVIVEALGLLDSGMRIPDTAVYLVDPEVGLVTDTGARTVDVPLLANLNFGKDLVRRESGRRFRLGISLNW